MRGITFIGVVFAISLAQIATHAGDGPPEWVRKLERFDIPFEIEWDVEIQRRPNHKLVEILREKNYPHYSPLQIERIAAGELHKKKYSMLALNCRNFRATLVDVNFAANNGIREYSSSQVDGSKVKNASGVPTYYPEPMRYFGALSTGLPQTQILDFLPHANRAKIIDEDKRTRIYELIADGK